uniref:Uncharacterized protein n=1 Tax=Alexandrium andersonii TaxID=327968 RepID=A0A7S2HLF6_9DINO|mmetsp:Transcript_72780/g.162947  ORF Transcript_72780/g.162947 Transcript_72780/m.162947 type:complete len:205 (+) Transcript_72780:104-718(+)
MHLSPPVRQPFIPHRGDTAAFAEAEHMRGYSLIRFSVFSYCIAGAYGALLLTSLLSGQKHCSVPLERWLEVSAGLGAVMFLFLGVLISTHGRAMVDKDNVVAAVHEVHDGRETARTAVARHGLTYTGIYKNPVLLFLFGLNILWLLPGAYWLLDTGCFNPFEGQCDGCDTDLANRVGSNYFCELLLNLVFAYALRSLRASARGT